MWGVSDYFLIFFQTPVAQTNEHYKRMLQGCHIARAMSHIASLTLIHPAKWTA